jgi:hypothetical protein
VIDPRILEQVAKALNIPTDAIKRFNDDAAINIIANIFNDNAVNMNYQCTFNPIEKWLEMIDENKKLYGQLLQAERDKNELLQKLLNKKTK